MAQTGAGNSESRSGRRGQEWRDIFVAHSPEPNARIESALIAVAAYHKILRFNNFAVAHPLITICLAVAIHNDGYIA